MRLASKLAAALAVFFCCLSGFGQAAPISGQAIDQNGAPLPYAQVRVCSVTSSGTPCTPTTPIYLDYNLTIPAANPYTSDSYGNYTVYAPALAAPNLYVVELSPASGVTWTYVENGPYCSIDGCTFLGPITAPYYNATEFPYYEVNGVQIASTNLLDSANLARLNVANVFTMNQTAPTFTSTVSTGTAPFTVSSTTIVPNLNVSELNGCTWAVPCPLGSTTPNTIAGTTGIFSGNLTAQSNLILGAEGVDNYLEILPAVSSQAIFYVDNSGNTLRIGNGAPGNVPLTYDDAGNLTIPGIFHATTVDAALNGTLGATTPNTVVGTTGNFSGTLQAAGITGTSVTDSGLTSGHCVQAGTGGILGTISSACAIAPTFTGTSGYQEESSGLIDEWVAGPSESANFVGVVTVTLPYTFPTACLPNSVQLGMQVPSGGPTGNGQAYVNYFISCTSSTVTFYMDVGPDSVGTVTHNALVLIKGY